MRATEAYANLKRLDRPVVTTGEAAACLDVAEAATSRLLSRLTRDGLIFRLRKGLWALDPQVEPYVLPAFLTAPYPSYISTWSALFHHGIIDQIPREVYVVSLDRSKRISTPLGAFVVQHMRPELFKGFETRDGFTMATPEKALFDTLYLNGARGRRYSRLPELEIPDGFKYTEVHDWIKRISLRRLRALVEDQVQRIAGPARKPAMARRSE